MSQTTVATDVHQSLDVHLNALAEIAFDLSLCFQNRTNSAQLVFAEIPHASVEIHAGFLEHRTRSRATYTVDVSQTNLGSLVRWQINSCYTCHRISRYPCLCLCLGLTQITRTTPLRWMTLHLSHIFFTDARTFIAKPLSTCIDK